MKLPFIIQSLHLVRLRIFLLFICIACNLKASDENNFDGIWETNYGMMRLTTKDNKVSGTYFDNFHGTIEGELKDDKFTFRFEDPESKGTGFFEMSENKQAFSGKWKSHDSEELKEWSGERVEYDEKNEWFIIIEEHWEEYIAEEQYSLGDMLKAFVEPYEGVEIRHRYYTGKKSLLKWLQQLVYTPGPIYLIIAGHGETGGLSINDETINEDIFINTVAKMPNIKLLHFASCSIMKGDVAKNIRKAISGKKFPISGFTTDVDWTQSAIMEMMYFTLMIEEEISPSEATKQLKLNYPSAFKEIKGSVYENAGFKILE